MLFKIIVLAQHGDQNLMFSLYCEKCCFKCVLEKRPKTIRGVAKINKARFGQHICGHRRTSFCNTSRVILRFFMLSQMSLFSLCYGRITILLPMRVPASFLRRAKKPRYITKMLFWLQPGACHYLPCPLNSSHKHVFNATFSFSLRWCFF